jgi:hypothetical protein
MMIEFSQHHHLRAAEWGRSKKKAGKNARLAAYFIM